MFFSKPIKRLKYNPDEIFQAVHDQLKGKLTENCNIRFSDRTYASITRGEAFAFVRNIGTDYIKEVNDCDDYTYLAKAEAIKQQRNKKFDGYPALFGQSWTPSHAFNWYITNGAIEFIDNDGTIIKEFPEKINLLLL